MATSTIPTDWLEPKKASNEWIFQCDTSLPDLVQTNRAARYFRQLVTYLEDDQQLFDYHLKLCHDPRRNNHLDVSIFFGDSGRTSNPIRTPVCISCEPTHELSATSLLSEQKYTRAWLDGRAREILILTPIRHIERLADLRDEDGEMEAFWYDAVELVSKEGGQLGEVYPNMALNHGTYRYHAHLHLKINFTKRIWDETIVPRHREQIERLKQLCQTSTIARDCFGEDYLKECNRLKNTTESRS